MLARQRQAFILDRVREDGAVRVADLVRELGVSDMTVRRDLEILDERGLLEKVHGGATSIAGSAVFEPGFAVKSSLQQAEKDAIADAAVGLAEPGMAVAVSAGTTTYALAQRLANVPGITVVTNSIQVADVLHRVGRSDQTIILTGGVRTPSDALVGPFAVAALRTVHVDLVFVGRPRHGPAVGVHLPEPARGGHGPGAHRGRPAAGGRHRPFEVGRRRHQLDRPLRPGRRHGHRRRARRPRRGSS